MGVRGVLYNAQFVGEERTCNATSRSINKCTTAVIDRVFGCVNRGVHER